MGGSFGDWKIIKELGQGGQGSVFLVQNIKTGQHGALKNLKNLRRIGRLVNEQAALRKIEHGNVVRVLDSNFEDKPFIVLEYVEGRSLGEITPEELSSIPLNYRYEWFFQICSGLKAAHQHGLIHRDLKPENILIGADRIVRICDFGLVYIDEDNRLTETLEQVGSRYFISPECEEGRSDDITSKTDIYSLGKILYYLLSGGIRFPRELQRAPKYDLRRMLNDPAMEAFSRILDKTIVQNPDGRLEDVEIMEKEVKKAVNLHEAKLPIAGVQETYRCVFCGVGRYVQVSPKKGASTHNLGYFNEGNVAHEHFAFLECQNCGNSQRFKMKYDKEGWFEEA